MKTIYKNKCMQLYLIIIYLFLNFLFITVVLFFLSKKAFSRSRLQFAGKAGFSISSRFAKTRAAVMLAFTYVSSLVLDREFNKCESSFEKVLPRGNNDN